MTFKSCDVWQAFYHNYSNLSDSIYEVCLAYCLHIIWC